METVTAKMMNKKPDGYLQYQADQIEEMKIRYEWTEIDGMVSFPFHYLKISFNERIYLPIKKKRKYTKKQK